MCLPRSLTASTLIALALIACGDDNGGPTNQTPNQKPPIAEFAPACNLLECTFTETSTDDGQVAAWQWDFGDQTPLSAEQDPVHAYATEGQYRVTLKVTDDEAAVDSVSNYVAVTPTPTCAIAGAPDDIIPCYVLVPGGSALSVTISSESDCTVTGDTLRIVGGLPEDVFTDGCHAQKDVPIPMNSGNPYPGLTNLYIAVLLQSDDPNRVAPRAQVQGGFPEWHVRLDDGGNPSSANEPDFNDLVFTFTATIPTNSWDYLRAPLRPVEGSLGDKWR